MNVVWEWDTVEKYNKKIKMVRCSEKCVWIEVRDAVEKTIEYDRCRNAFEKYKCGLR